jgi:nitroreductase
VSGQVPLPPRRLPADPGAAAREFLDLMKSRHTVRDFSARPVPQALIETCIATAGTAPSGANRQPWFFVLVGDPAVKALIREGAEAEERDFYAGGAGEEWLAALAPLGTGPVKAHLTAAPWLIVVFAERWGTGAGGERIKNYYVPESVGIACGLLIAALHVAGLSVLTHTPAPMKFLNAICGRPEAEKPVMILAVGHAAEGATVPQEALRKKALAEIMALARA